MLPNSSIPNSMNMEFNWLTFNGKSGPASTPLVIRHGERVRIRLINMGMDHHPIHLHGFTFWETGREGARQQESAWTRGNTTLVGVAQARDIEFVADRAGRLDAALPSSAPHDESDGVERRPHDARRPRHAGRRRHGGGHGHAAGRQCDLGKSRPSSGAALALVQRRRLPQMALCLRVKPIKPWPICRAWTIRRCRNGSRQHAGDGGMTGELPNAQVPLFPQDAFMEGPMMAMDKDVEKPGDVRFACPAGADSRGGMMTLVRGDDRPINTTRSWR